MTNKVKIFETFIRVIVDAYEQPTSNLLINIGSWRHGTSLVLPKTQSKIATVSHFRLVLGLVDISFEQSSSSV